MVKLPDARIRASRILLENPYAYLDEEGGYDSIPHQGPLDLHESRRLSGNPYAFLDENGEYGEYRRPDHGTELVPETLRSDALLDNKRKGDRFTKREIEKIARRLQIELWKQQSKTWPNGREMTFHDVLEPSVALRLIGYQFDVCESLGQYSNGYEIYEVAGTVDEYKKSVQVSRRFSREIQNFTASHELGHAILHQATGLHRDRAQDGGSGNVTRDEKETEADLFAAFFLMPEKPVKKVFNELFQASNFTICEETAFALGFQDISELEGKCRTLRDLARLLASVEGYNGLFFPSLARQFRVSIEAMAIRLEELGLVRR